jgi:hypothetical protein
MIIPTEEVLTALLIQQFRNIGLDRTLGSLSVEEIDSISESLKAHIIDSQTDDEPPF